MIVFIESQVRLEGSLVGHLVQPAQGGMVNIGCSGLCAGGSCKPPRMATAQPHRTPALLSACAYSGKPGQSTELGALGSSSSKSTISSLISVITNQASTLKHIPNSNIDSRKSINQHFKVHRAKPTPNSNFRGVLPAYVSDQFEPHCAQVPHK